jgi:Protein of unknown function (DUF5132)
MRFSPMSFLLGLVAASLVPALSRVFRPLAVEATAAGLGMIEDARRLLAEQVEMFEDIAAEARARRDQLDADALSASAEEAPEQEAEDHVGAGRARRRTNGAGRRRSS